MTPIFAVVDYYILAFSAITVVVTIWMGFRSAKTSKTASDFFVAGRSVSVGWNASAISGEYLSAASFMGIAGMVMSSGYDALWYPVCYACGYLFLLLFIAGPLRRFGAYTIPDFAEGRYDSPLFRKIAVCFVLFIGFFYTMPQMKGAGTTLAYIFPGLPYWAGVVLVGAVITLNVALGGMKGITLVQAFQYWAKMFAISVPIFVLMAVYGHYGKQLEVNGDVQHPTSNVQRSTNAANAALEAENLSALSNITWTKTTHSTRGSTGNLVTEAMLTFSEWKQKHVPNPASYSFAARPPALCSIHGLLNQCMEVSGKRYILPKDIAAGSITFGHSNTLNGAQWVAAFESALQTGSPEWWENGKMRRENLAVYQKDVDTVYVVSQNLLAAVTNAAGHEMFSLRKPLPEKAPKDETWISPFGPLTTKAAKAAAANLVQPDWSKRANLVNPDPVAETPEWRRDLEQLAQGKLPEGAPRGLVRYGTGDEGKPLSEITFVLQHWAHLSAVLCESNLLTKNFVWNSTNFQSPTELVVSLEKGLSSNGVSVVRASSKEWWLVSSADAKSYLKPFDTKPYSLLYTYSLIIALICGTAGLPHILVRFYTNPDGGAAKRTTMWVMILIGIFYVFPPVFGVMGRNLFPELYNGIGAKGTDKIVLELPRLLNEKYAPLGSILSGITCAGAFAAFMSTFSGLLVSMTGALAHDVYGRMLRPKSTPEQRMRMFKFAAVLIGFVSILLGSLVEPLEINFMVGQAFAIAAASYFPLLFMSVWWRGMTMRGAAVGMLTGGLCALVAAMLTNVSNLALDKGPMGKIFAGFAGMNDFWAHHPLLRILCEQPAIWTVPLAITLMIVVSKATRNEVPSDVRMKMLVLHAPEKLGLKQEYIQEHQAGH